jgi:hypothetical protein
VLEIKCLSGGCPKRYSEIEIKNYVDSNVYYKFRKFYNKQIKQKNPDNIFISCPIVNCEELIDITQIDTRINMLDCNNGHGFCIRCKKENEHGRDECKAVYIIK